MLGNSRSAAVKAFNAMGLNKSVGISEETEIQKAERAVRLNELFHSEVWEKDLLPIIRRLYDDALNAVKTKSLDPDALKILDDLMVRLGGSLQLGIGAMERLAQRRLNAAEQQEQLVQSSLDITSSVY